MSYEALEPRILGWTLPASPWARGMALACVQDFVITLLVRSRDGRLLWLPRHLLPRLHAIEPGWLDRILASMPPSVVDITADQEQMTLSLCLEQCAARTDRIIDLLTVLRTKRLESITLAELLSARLSEAAAADLLALDCVAGDELNPGEDWLRLASVEPKSLIGCSNLRQACRAFPFLSLLLKETGFSREQYPGMTESIFRPAAQLSPHNAARIETAAGLIFKGEGVKHSLSASMGWPPWVIRHLGQMEPALYGPNGLIWLGDTLKDLPPEIAPLDGAELLAFEHTVDIREPHTDCKACNTASRYVFPATRRSLASRRVSGIMHVLESRNSLTDYLEVIDSLFRAAMVKGDYDLAEDGFLGSPCLETLMRMSAAWHAATVLDHHQQYRLAPTNERRAQSLAWKALFDDTIVVENHEFRCLTTEAMLIDEGVELKHCVGTFADLCEKGGCHIVSMQHKERRILTIEISLQGGQDDPIISIEQIGGHKNRPADEEEQRIIEKFMTVLPQRLTAQPRRATPAMSAPVLLLEPRARALDAILQALSRGHRQLHVLYRRALGGDRASPCWAFVSAELERNSSHAHP